MKKIKSVFRFPSDMYVSPIGSYVISCFLLSGDSNNEVAISGIKARWETAVRRKKKFDLCDLQGIADYFHVPYTLEPIAMVQSEYNILFLPYDGNQLYPIREDGFINHTMTAGKIYPLTNNKEVGDVLQQAE